MFQWQKNKHAGPHMAEKRMSPMASTKFSRKDRRTAIREGKSLDQPTMYTTKQLAAAD